MKRAFPLLAVLLLATAFQLGRGARADGEHKPSPWEYRVFLVDAREFHDKDDWKAMVAKNDGNEFHADADFKAYVLNHLSKEEGWELVQALQPVKDKPEIVHLYLRRPRGSEVERKPSPWDYRVFLVDAREFHDKDDWKEMVAKNGGNEFHADGDFKAYVLNHLSKEEGWELVQVIQPVKDKPEIVHLYLRRPRS